MPRDVGFLMTATRFFRVGPRNAVMQSQHPATLDRDKAQPLTLRRIAPPPRCNQQRLKSPVFEIRIFLVRNLLRRKQEAISE
jgi:hypothetical protein